MVYWGHYVAHDNNRDAIGLSLKLTRNVLNTYLAWKPQVLHDLHESVPYLYDNTIGDGPYNAWVDPILTDEWQMIGWNNVSEMTKFGMPGVFAHGNFDTWSPGYLMFIAATHNGISRLYETFGNAGADTVERTLVAERVSTHVVSPESAAAESEVVAAKQQQLPADCAADVASLLQQQQQTLSQELLSEEQALDRQAEERRSGGLCFPGDDPRPGNQAELLRTLQAQGVRDQQSDRAVHRCSEKESRFGASAPAPVHRPSASPTPAPKTEDRTFPAGSYIVRMDQPYSRIADALLDYQYWAPNDPQTDIYDDTAWTMGELANVEVVRVVDAKVLHGADGTRHGRSAIAGRDRERRLGLS